MSVAYLDPCYGLKKHEIIWYLMEEREDREFQTVCFSEIQKWYNNL